MNERIFELAKQADIILSMTEFTGCLKGQDYLVTDSNLSEMQLKKFAELIIQECLSNVFYYEEDEEQDRISESIHERIKQHFGVDS